MEEIDYKVVQSKDLNNAKYEESYTMLEKKLILKLISTITPEDESFELKSIDVNELNFFGDKQKNHSYIHYKVCRTILKKPLEVNGLWCNWFIKLGCKNGLVYYQFDDDLKNHLLSIEDNYNDFFLSNVMALKKYHAIRIYEIISLMVKWKNSKQVFHRRMDWEEFKILLNIGDGYRNNDIKPKIIEQAQKEIQEKSDLKFNFEIYKNGRNYDYINFVISKNKG